MAAWIGRLQQGTHILACVCRPGEDDESLGQAGRAGGPGWPAACGLPPGSGIPVPRQDVGVQPAQFLTGLGTEQQVGFVVGGEGFSGATGVADGPHQQGPRSVRAGGARRSRCAAHRRGRRLGRAQGRARCIPVQVAIHRSVLPQHVTAEGVSAGAARAIARGAGGNQAMDAGYSSCPGAVHRGRS
jgi:hypothetical protein